MGQLCWQIRGATFGKWMCLSRSTGNANSSPPAPAAPKGHVAQHRLLGFHLPAAQVPTLHEVLLRL